ncbi:MAG: hypothetical protein WC683_07465 [bacterium]
MPRKKNSLPEDMQAALAENELLVERIVELELALEDIGWQSLTETDREFSRDALRRIVILARLYWLKNPLIKRAVETQTCYVFALGVTTKAKHPAIDAVIQAFIDDEKNKAELFDHQALMLKETELQLFANLFFVFFINSSTGRVRIRTVPFHEVQRVVYNPEDSNDPWYYLREWQEFPLDTAGPVPPVRRAAYYPDWRYRPRDGHPATLYGIEVRADTPIYHVKVNALSDMQFGVSEVYAGLDWARAYKEYLENWASVAKALARIATVITTKGGKKGVTAAKTRLASTLSNTGTGETNPAPVQASTFIQAEGTNLQPFRTAGAQAGMDDGRRLMLMVCSSTGIMEPELTGDPSTGNLATAKTMERPMELRFRARQELWKGVMHGILQYVVNCSVRAENGPIGGTVAVDEWTGDETITLELDTENPDETKRGKPLDRTIDVTFPPMLEHDANVQVAAIKEAATLGGLSQARTMPKMLLSRLLLQALGVENIDAVLDELFPDGEPEPEDEPPVSGSDDDREIPKLERAMVEAARELRDAIRAAKKAGVWE